MKLSTWIDISAGGPGSGCNPEVADPGCGRPKGSSSKLSEHGHHYVDDIEEAVRLISEGKIVELRDAKEVHVLLERLAALANTAAATGKHYDLCNVHVQGTNIFCIHNKGIPRIAMPQFAGVPVPGSEADKLQRSQFDQHAVDASEEFIAHMKSIGVKVTSEGEKAAYLRATQNELIGTKVAAIMKATKFDITKVPIFVSRDNYVIDGHHRWAAIVGRDSEDGKLGDLEVPVIRVDAPISEVIKIANEWTDRFGLPHVSAK